jgi:hypothetical protein
MKKIKTNKQLRIQKKQLLKRQEELEALIHANWIELKQSLKPKSMAGEFFSKTFQNSNEHGSTLAESLSSLAAILTKMAVEKAEEHFSSRAK